MSIPIKKPAVRRVLCYLTDFPILKTLPLHTVHRAEVADLPFFMVTGVKSFASVLALHLKQ